LSIEENQIELLKIQFKTAQTKDIQKKSLDALAIFKNKGIDPILEVLDPNDIKVTPDIRAYGLEKIKEIKESTET
jgi:hypothetical protein